MPKPQKGAGSTRSNRADHLKPFQWPKGVSGNPAGPRREKPIAAAMKAGSNAVFTARFLRELGVRLPRGIKNINGSDLVALGQFGSAGKGKTEAAREIADRLDGKVPQGVYSSDAEGNLTTEEREARIAALMAIGRARAAKG